MSDSAGKGDVGAQVKEDPVPDGRDGDQTTEPEVQAIGNDEAAATEDAVSVDDSPDDSASADRERPSAAEPRIRVSTAGLPTAQDITRRDFTPHGIGAKGRPPKRLSKRQRRRRILLAGSLTVLVAAAGGTYYYIQNIGKTVSGVKVEGAFGEQPKVSIPDSQAEPGFQADTLVTGSGAKVASGDTAVVNYVAYSWNGTASKQLISSYTGGNPEPWPIGKMGLKGLDNGLTGKTAGSRVALSIPPEDGFGAQGNQQMGVGANDTLVFVVDVLGTYSKTASAQGQAKELTDDELPKVTAGAAGAAPKVEIPESDPPEELKAEALIEGTGPAVRKGQLLIAQYQGQIWRDGKIFDSSWRNGQILGRPIGAGQVIPGWDKSLVGKNVGSRILLVVPPAEGYGEQGQPQAGIKSDDTLVFVVDILGAY